ncbi:MAG: uracil phosphoribosyltransferase [Bacteroidales bacterium]
MKIINLSEQSSILTQYISEIRNKDIQKDKLRFRNNIERIGEIFAYEISKIVDYEDCEIRTPLGIANCRNLKQNIVIASIIRAALPLHKGFLNIFDQADNAFIGAYRKYGKNNKFTIHIDYVSAHEVDKKILILADTMLATGASIEIAYNRICQDGTPKHSHIVCPISSKQGIEYLSKNLPSDNVTLWVGSIDEELTNKSYIIPGLGDAGDLCFGTKL